MPFDVGPISLMPVLGLSFDFETQEAAYLAIPQLFTIVDSDSLYFESWIQTFLGSPFGSISRGDAVRWRSMQAGSL